MNIYLTKFDILLNFERNLLTTFQILLKCVDNYFVSVLSHHKDFVEMLAQLTGELLKTRWIRQFPWGDLVKDNMNEQQIYEDLNDLLTG